jgi:hypothetical protein
MVTLFLTNRSHLGTHRRLLHRAPASIWTPPLLKTQYFYQQDGWNSCQQPPRHLIVQAPVLPLAFGRHTRVSISYFVLLTCQHCCHSIACTTTTHPSPWHDRKPHACACTRLKNWQAGTKIPPHTQTPPTPSPPPK